MSCCNECEESNGCNDCGGNCGTAKEYITKQGIQGEDGYGYNAASTTSSDILDTVATSGAFTITTKKAYTPGARVRFSDSANPSTNYFEGIVTAYNALTGAMTVSSVDLKVGTGTIASWNVNLAGEIGADGTGFVLEEAYFEITKTFSDSNTNYLPISNSDSGVFNYGGSGKVDDWSAPSQSVGFPLTFDQATGYFYFTSSPSAFFNVKLTVNLPMPSDGQSDNANTLNEYWMTRRTIDAQTVVEAGSVSAYLAQQGAGLSSRDTVNFSEKVVVTRNTKSITIVKSTIIQGDDETINRYVALFNDTDMDYYGGTVNTGLGTFAGSVNLRIDKIRDKV